MPPRTSATVAVARPRPRFFGLHLDLHPGMKDTQLGRLVTEPMVRKILRAARPDYIQYDCKGHPGLLGYPASRHGPSAPGIVNDSLAIYRKATRAAGVELLVHFSGVWDDAAVAEHPEWAALDAEGKPSDKYTSVFGPYVTQRMIPQMREVVDRYGVDGFWVDGDCWAVQIDHCDQARQRFWAATGQPVGSPVPAKPGDPLWVEWLNVHRDQFFAYVRAWSDALHAHRPGIRLASNWLYSHQAPEPVKLPMDFVSGDYAANNSVNSARFAARYLSSTGLPWDLMAWSFAWFPGKRKSIDKPAVQLQQEAAQVLSMGGGFQLYFHPERHGGFSDRHITVMQEVADFCHQRRDFSFGTQPLAQVALLVDTTSHYRRTANVFAPWGGEYRAVEGALHAALEAGHSVDVLADHHLPWQQDHFPVIVLPEYEHVPTSVVYELVEYARRGGSLLLIGAATAQLFAEHLGVEFVGQPVELDAALHPAGPLGKGWRSPAPLVKGLWQSVRPCEPGQPRGKRSAAPRLQVLAHRTEGRRPEGDGADDRPAIAATLAPLGRGRIAAVYGPIASDHFGVHCPGVSELLGRILDRLYRPTLRIDRARSTALVDLAARRLGSRSSGRIVAQLASVAAMPTSPGPERGSYFFTHEVPPVGPVTLRLRCGRPRRVTLQPENRRLKFTWKNNQATIVVDRVHVHAAVVLE